MSINDAIICVLKVVSELVSRLIQLDVIRAGDDHHDDTAVNLLLDRTSKLRSLLCLPIRCESGARLTRSAPI